MTLKALIHKAEEGGYWAEVPGLPGCMTEGETLDQVKANILEAVQGWRNAAQNGTVPSPVGPVQLALALTQLGVGPRRGGHATGCVPTGYRPPWPCPST